MKYSLRPVNPPSNVARTASSNCASSTPLLMASRSTWVPASGASVSEPRWSAAKPARLSAAESMRSDGSDTRRPGRSSRMRGERLGDAAVVARAQGEERDLVAARLVEQAVGGGDHQVDRPLPHGPVPHARLAEAAAGGAAAHDLDDDAVVDGLEHRDHRPQDRIARREPHEDLALGGPCAAAGHPHAGDRRERPQARLAALLLHRGDDRLQVVLDLSDEERVEERGERPRVGDRGPAAEDDGVFPIPLGGVQRHAGQVEHLEDVGVAELVRQGEAPQVAVGDRSERLERPERHAACPHEVGHVRPRAVRPLGRGRRGVVQLTVEDLQRGVGDPDLVHVRIGQHDARTSPGLGSGVELAARVPPGARDARQKPRYLIRNPISGEARGAGK